MNEIKNGIIHVHSEYSLKDSAEKLETIFQRAIELGAPAIAITEHHTLAGIEESKTLIEELNKKNNSNLKLIPGVEVYLRETENSLNKRMHLVLLPKNITGYRELSKAVTESFNYFDSAKMPYMTFDILNNFFAEGTKGHGNVIATSACMVGPLSTKLLSNVYIDKEIKKLANKASGLASPEDESYVFNSNKYSELEAEVAALTEEIKRLNALIKKPYAKKIKTLSSLEGTPEYESMKNKLDAEMQESKDAEELIVKVRDKKTQIKSKQKVLKDACKADEKDHEKRALIEQNIAKFEKDKESNDVLYEDTVKLALKFQSIFGKDNFYIELQNHRIEEEQYAMPILAKLAVENDIPVVAANDAHMAYSNQDSVKARQIMRSLRFNTWEEISESDKELYIKTDEELSSILKEIIPEEIVNKAIDGIKNICETCNVEFKFEPHYPAFPSDKEGEDATGRLRRLSYEGIKWRYPEEGSWTEKHSQRLEHELSIISRLGYCDYLCIVEDFLRYGRLLGKIDLKNPDPRYLADPYNMELLEEITKNDVGLGIGPARGSAAGSLVCYLVGITAIDPMKYDLLFERFLNPERVSMPDIDSDFKTDIRDKVLDYVKYKYGEKAVCCIMTRGAQKAKATIRNCARLLGSQQSDDTSKFLSLGDEMAKMIPDSNTDLDACWEDLIKKYSSNKDAMTILENAHLVEGTFTTIGMHAAGVIIADNGDVREYVPLLYNTDKHQWCCQCDMVQSEAIGLLKMDFLGLRNLDVITDTLKSIKDRYGINIDTTQMPLEKDVFKHIFSTGNTNSIFQFESGGMKSMLKQFKPENIEDVILLVAAYRPGPMQFLDDIIAVKSGKKAPDYITPELESILGKTYGAIIYQEQVMEIFQKLAGYSLGGADMVRRAMSKKKYEKLAHERDSFIHGDKDRNIIGCEANGIPAEKANKLFDQMMDFAAYAFNKSHAAAYAFVAYYTAWLKYHYPVEYLCAVLNNTDFEKIGAIINSCKVFNISVLPPNINMSDEVFSIKDKNILYGLGLIKNVGASSTTIIKEREKGPFTSFGDFMNRTKCDKGVAESLIKAGAFDDFTKNRKVLIMAVPGYVAGLKKIRDKEKKITEYEEKICKLEAKIEPTKEDTKSLNRTQLSLKKAKDTLNELYYDVNNIPFASADRDTPLQTLKDEKEMLGVYVSAHPLDNYKSPKEINCTPIDELTDKSNASIFGIITELRIAFRKSDNKPMAFFVLEDQSGKIQVNVFTTPFSQYNQLIKEDNIVKIKGRCNQEEFNDEEFLTFTAKEIIPVEEQKECIYIDVKSVVDWQENILNKVKPYSIENGHKLIVYDRSQSNFRTATFTVSNAILDDKSFNTHITK